MAVPPLRSCPACGTPVSYTSSLGLRDYTWFDAPGGEGGMDLDFVYEKRGRVLVHEYKPEGVALPTGQRITLTALRRKGIEIWVVEESSARTERGWPITVRRGILDPWGRYALGAPGTVETLNEATRAWRKRYAEDEW